MEYHKINSIYKRGERGRFLEGEWAEPEFGYLADLPWHATEKIDGTNTRIYVTVDDDQVLSLRFGGRTDDAQIPTHLLNRLEDIFRTGDMAVRLAETFGRGSNTPVDVVLYGEGYGAKIQKGGGNYIPDGCNFILFDVRIGEWWLLPEAVTEIADKLGIRRVPLLGSERTLNEWIEFIRNDKLTSAWPEVKAEGVVLTPKVPLFNRKGERIITKVKQRDFK